MTNRKEIFNKILVNFLSRKLMEM